MRRTRFRFVVPFASGVAVAALLLGLSGSVTSLAATRYEDLNLFTSVLNLVRKNYVEDVDEHALIEGAVKGMLAALDPHSSYLNPDTYREMQVDTKGEFAGLGIEIAKRRDGFIEVISPIEGTPAQRAGVKARDMIVGICPTTRPPEWTEPCHGTKNMTLVEAVKLMRGRKGTKITIQIDREGFELPQPYTIIRDIVKIVSVDTELLEDGYGYVRLRAFQERTGRDLREALAALRAEHGGPLTGVVLDMRDNPGGLLDQAVEVADVWLSGGLVVYTKGRIESQRHEFRAHPEETESGYPMVVLVNAGTASASEIVAGALQDQDRALVLGTRSFGKGSVQTIIPLEDGSGLRLTTALYYTPADRSIQEVGIEPDIIVEMPSESAQHEVTRRRRVREADLEGHFTIEDADPSGEVPDEPEAPADPPAEAPASDLEAAVTPEAETAATDVQLTRALEVLKSWAYFEKLSAANRSRGTPEVQTLAKP